MTIDAHAIASYTAGILRARAAYQQRLEELEDDAEHPGGGVFA